MVVGDDCSTDGTYEKALEAARGHEGIKVHQNEQRLYCADNYQKMLEMATGEICGVLDGDDVIAPHAMDRINHLYKKYAYVGIGWIYTQSWWCNDDLKPRRKGLSRLPIKGELLNNMGRRMKHSYSHWRTFKTELRERRKPLFEKGLKCAVDKSLGYVLEELAPGGYLDECLYYYRYHRENMSHKTHQRSVWRKVVENAVKRRRKRNLVSKKVVQVK